jgi:hypothetical protein
MTGEAVLDLLEFGRPEPSLENSHDFERFGFRRSKSAQEVEVLNPSDCTIDGANVTNLVIRLTEELTNQFAELLSRQNEPGRITWRGIETSQLFAEADEKQGSCVPERLSSANPRHDIATFRFDLAEKCISFGLVDNHFLADLTKVVRYGVPLGAKRFP